MSYQLYSETCSSYELLKQRLKARGFTELSMGATPMLQMDAYNAGPVVSMKNVKRKSVMIQKGQRKPKYT